MKILDVNLLLYAVNQDSPHHAQARKWLEETLSGAETVGFAWTVLLAFLRLSTKPAIFSRPLTPADAFAILESWLSQPCSEVIHPSDQHPAILKKLLLPLGAAGNLTSDAHLAALAIEHGAELCSTDRDFGRFAGLKWMQPLE